MPGMKGRSGGHNRVPSTIKRSRGTLRKDRQRPNEPTPAVRLPPPPPWLSIDARKTYRRLGHIVVSMRVCTEVDGDSLALAAAACEDYTIASEALRQDGPILTRTTETGVVKYRHPAAVTKERAWRAYRDALRSFGMDPQSRAGVSAIPETDDENASARFFN